MKLLIIFLLFLLTNSCELIKEPGNCTQAKQLYAGFVNGKIKKKYIWTENHGSRVLEIRLTNKDIYKFFCGSTSSHQDFYAYAQVGDSIYKKIKSLDVKIIKPDGVSKVFFINYNCPYMEFLDED